MRASLFAVLLAAAAVAAGCGEQPSSGGDRSAVDVRAAAPDPKAEETAAPSSDLPDLTVRDLAGGEVRLAELAPSDKPVLLWFWAPHCPTCNAEARSVDAFARRVSGELTVVGLGAQDSEEEAHAFVAEHEVRAPQMLYDASFESWRHFGINGQPAAVLLDGDGVAREGWFGPLLEDEILERARAL